VRVRVAVLIILTCSMVLPARSQKRAVDPRLSHYRVVVLDQIISDGHGHRMPAHAAAAGTLGFVVLAYHSDGKHVLVELVGTSYHTWDALRSQGAANADPMMFSFDKALVPQATIAAAVKAAGFPNVDLSKTFVRVP